MVVGMGLVLAFVTSLVCWIVVWAVGFGMRTDDAFFVTVPPIMLIAAAVHVLRSPRESPR
jgi:hypothetical protein